MIPENTVFLNGPVPVSGDQLNTFLQGVTTIASLRTFIGVSGMTVFLQGSAAPNDGGGGMYLWNPNPGFVDNGTTVIVPTAAAPGAWLRVEVGEYLGSAVLVGTPVSLTTATPANVTSLSLAAGDWDVWGNVGFVPAGTTTVTNIQGWISTVSATSPSPNNGASLQLTLSFTTGQGQLVPVGRTRLNLSVTTTVYLGAQAAFAVSTMGAYGLIAARRVG